jgi:hypothetical protein
MRRNIRRGLLFGLRVVWPVLSILLVAIVALGLLVGLLEGWSVHESIYFAFVSGLTIAMATSRRGHCSRARSRS